jgi:hypothetical protein
MQSKIFLILLLLTLNLFAVEGKMRVELQSHENLYTSQKVIVAVELMTDAFSISDARITFPTSSKYIVNAPKSAAYIRTEEINGTDWQVVHYEYEVYALQAGEIKIPSIKATFSASMGYGQPKKAFELKSKSLYFEVKAPEGVKNNQFVLVTDDYTLESEMKPEKKQLIVGDAIEVKVTQKVHGVPDILLRPIVYRSNEHIRVYKKEPELQSGISGKLDVSRTDSFTFVAIMEGNVTIPVQKIVWWNSVAKKVQVETLAEIFFEIIPDPQIEIDEKQAYQKRLWGYLVLIALILFLLYKLFASLLKRYITKRKKLYEESEEGQFKALLDSIEKNDIPIIYKDLYSWLAVVSPEISKGGFREIKKVYPALYESLCAFENTLIDPHSHFDIIVFSNELKLFRKKLLKQYENESKNGALVSYINPN